MAPTFITASLAPCQGSPVHLLTCGHTIHPSFFHPKASSKCAPNCRDVNIATNAEPNFLCPTCYESLLRDNHRRFMDHCWAGDAKASDPPVLWSTIEIIKRAHHTSDRLENRGFDLWCGVGQGNMTFEKAMSISYKWKVEAKGLRECKAVKIGCS